MFSKEAAVLQGTIELLVLKRLSQGPMHGYGIATWVETGTDRGAAGRGRIALSRPLPHGAEALDQRRMGLSENTRRAKFYRLTTAGQREFVQQASGWLRLSAAVSRAVTAGGPR